jgi:catechol 2,3-dioxygenase-like lactoylglutathione lyase family enzyme
LARGLDHIVHAVRDLDAAAELYARLGFIVSAGNRHPWGTHNRIVQLDGVYIELLTVGEPEKIEAHGARSFSFGAFHRDFLARGEGFAMLLLNTRDAKADAAAYRAASIGDFDVFNFERQGLRPDGSAVKLAFSLVFATDTKSPEVGFGACQHYYPENFWSQEFQKHANGMKRIAGVVLVADEPKRHRDFLLAYTGASATNDTETGFEIDLPNGMIDVMTPTAFAARFGMLAPDTLRGARFAALRFAARQDDGAAVKGPKAVMGAVLAFQ